MTDLSELFGKKQEAETPAAPEPTQPTNPFAALAQTVKETASQPAPAPTPEPAPAPKPAPVIDELQQAPTAIGAAEFNSPDQPDMVEGEAVALLQQNMEMLRNSFEHKELVGDAIRGVLVHLKRYPFLKDILLPEDCQTMVRALRESYGVAIVSKTTRAKKVSATQKEVGEVEDMLSDLGL